MNSEGQDHSLTLVKGQSDSTFSNFFSLETAWPNEARFHVEPPWDRGTKVYSNGPGCKINTAAMPIYGKNLKKIFFSGTKRPMTMKLGMQRRVLKYYQVCLNDDPGLTLIYFKARSNLVPYVLYGEKVKQWIFQKLLFSMISKLVGAVN